MLPFTIDRLILSMDEEIEEISKNIMPYKFKFCTEFENELGMDPSEYSQSVFDYVFNLYFFSKAFDKVTFKRYLDELRGLNFLNPAETCDYISKKYLEFIFSYKKYFMDYFGFNSEDPYYIQRKMQANRSEITRKLVEYY